VFFVTNFTGTVALSGSQGGWSRTNAILGNAVADNSSSGNYTFGYSFTPTTNIVVTHVRHYSGNKVSIWTDSGSLLASQNVVSTPGSWVETVLPTPLALSADVTYRVAVYSANGSYFYRYDLPSTFPDGTINQSYEAYGDIFPTRSSFSVMDSISTNARVSSNTFISRWER